MAIKTTYEQIIELDEAITKSLAALELAGPGGDRAVRNRVDALYKQRDKLLTRYQREQGAGGPSFNVGIMRGHD
ncbi:MAG: hypothetical protein SWH61_03345 [Thermodesulfobacteriota bacterium]|nr:hypothetical protein [Thermodesulfobacteriota bacterium]